MIKKIALCMACFLFVTNVSAADFIATVNKNKVAMNEIIDLKLTLEGVTVKGGIDIGALEDNFIIRRQSQSSNVSIINGSSSSSKSWIVRIMPKSLGMLTIPSFSISTKEGVLRTAPIHITVDKAAKQNDKIKISGKISKRNPYVNEVVIYKVKITSKINVHNTNLQVPESDDFILEQLGDIKQYQEVNNGISSNINEITYLLTPLKTGSINIDPVILNGDIVVRRRDRFFGGFSVFDDNDYKPFSISGRKIRLNVKKAQSDLDKWLPLHSLKLAEDWLDIDKAQVGEPINRSISITAIGTKAAQLPKVEYMQSGKEYKIYSDKPNVSDSNNKESIPVAGKSISYTIIPQKSGKITIPKIIIPWWDVKKSKMRYTTLPQKVIDVKDSDRPVVANNDTDIRPDSEREAQISGIAKEISFQDKWLIIALAISCILLILAVIYIVILRKKLSTYNATSKIGEKGRKAKYDLNNIKSARNIEGLENH